MLNNIETALKQAGLSPEQISVYLFLVQNEDETPFNISKNVRIPRTTIYRILEDLRNLGIVTIFKKNNIAHYTAENPRRLVERLKEKETALTDILPSIDSLFENTKSHPQAGLYVGQNGARTSLDILYEYLERKNIKQVYTYSHPDLSRHLPKYLSTIIARRRKLKIHAKMIAPSEANTPKLEHYQPDEWREVRYLPNRFPFDGTMILGGSMAVCFSLKDNQLHTIVLESESIVKMFIQFFLYTWESLEK